MKIVKAASLPLRTCSLWSGAQLALVNFHYMAWTCVSMKVRLHVLMEEIKGGTCLLHFVQGLLSDIFLFFIFPMNDSCGAALCCCSLFSHQSFPISSVIFETFRNSFFSPQRNLFHTSMRTNMFEMKLYCCCLIINSEQRQKCHIHQLD